MVTYICDEQLQSMVALNDHDYLIVVGTPPGGESALHAAHID